MPSERMQWEYLMGLVPTVDLFNGHMPSWIEDVGLDGWEMVAMTPINDDSINVAFKRPRLLRED